MLVDRQGSMLEDGQDSTSGDRQDFRLGGKAHTVKLPDLAGKTIICYQLNSTPKTKKKGSVKPSETLLRRA